MKKYLLSGLLLAMFCITEAQQGKAPVPTKQQLAWHDMEFYLFTHFGPNTFTDKEWGHGDEPEDIFNPTEFDAGQWCRIAKQAGAKGIIITAKHHDGFCLWPSKYSAHTVRESKWKDGKGDVLKELSAACKKYDLKFGVYISPWDRNHPDYGTEKYNDVFVNMMKELFTNYGPIWELWWDGANGEGPNGKKQVYDWSRFRETVKKLSPNTLVFSDVGPQIRWVGNESGIAGETNWNMLDTAGFTAGAGAPSTEILNTGNMNGNAWIPAECDVSIRPGWFYHKAEDSKVKIPEQLFELYLKSVGRGANLLLNVPPDGRGLITKYDSAALVGFKKIKDQAFQNNLILGSSAIIANTDMRIRAEQVVDGNHETSIVFDEKYFRLTLSFKKPEKINCIVLREAIKYGQKASEFSLIAYNDSSRVNIKGTTIGRKRILTFKTLTASVITLIIPKKAWPVKLGEIEAYLIDENLVEK